MDPNTKRSDFRRIYSQPLSLDVSLTRNELSEPKESEWGGVVLYKPFVLIIIEEECVHHKAT